MSRNITATIATMVHEALEAQGHEDVDYDVSMALVPGEGGQPQSLVAITFSVSSVVVGEAHAATAAIPPSIPHEDALADLVRSLATGLKGQRSEMAERQMAQANGSKPGGASGLILPGS